MAGSLGMATGPLPGGWIYDASSGMGVRAFPIALTFTPVRTGTAGGVPQPA